MRIQTADRLDHGVWCVDRSRSAIEFRIRHFGVATVRGHFDSFAARIDAGDDGLRVDGRVDAASVDPGNATLTRACGPSSSTSSSIRRSRCARLAAGAVFAGS